MKVDLSGMDIYTVVESLGAAKGVFEEIKKDPKTAPIFHRQLDIWINSVDNLSQLITKHYNKLQDRA